PIFFFYYYPHHPHLHSFPTRRSSDLEQVRAFLEIDEIDVILLDNMKRTEMREAVALRKNKVKFEASGGITLKNIRQIEFHFIFPDRKSTRLNSSHVAISYAVFCLKKK